jgi:hypothetical protein
MPFDVKRRAGLAKMGIGPLFWGFLKIGLQMLFKLMPALLKWGLVLIVPDAILDGHLPIIFGAILDPFLDPFFEARWRDDLPVYGCFLGWGCSPGPVFGPLLDRTFVPVFRHFQTRTCSLSYKNSLDVCLPIANKSVHPLRVRSVAK